MPGDRQVRKAADATERSTLADQPARTLPLSLMDLGQDSLAGLSGHVLAPEREHQTPASGVAPTSGDDDIVRIGFAAFSAACLLLAWNETFAELFCPAQPQLRRGMRFASIARRMAAMEMYRHPEGQAFLTHQVSQGRNVASRMHLRDAGGRLLNVASEPLPDGGWLMLVTEITSGSAALVTGSPARSAPLESILASIPHGICVYAPDGRLQMMNPAYVEIMKGAPISIGETVDEIIVRRAAAGEFGPGDPQDILRREKSRDLGRPGMRRRVRPNGTVIDVRTAPLPGGGHMSVVTDITQLNRAEEEAARRAGEMDVMLASIRHGIVLMSADHRVVASNPVATELLGQDPRLLRPGSNLADILRQLLATGDFGDHPDPQTFVRERLELDRRRPHASTLHTAKDRHLEVRSDPTSDGGFVLTLTDVTDEVRTEAELRNAKRAAEASNQAKSRFLATMSHELRTPLNAVIGFSDALMREATGISDPAQIGEFAQEINEAGRQLLSLVNNILDVARIDAGRFDLAADRIDLGRLLQIAARQFGQAARAAELTLSVDVEDNIPELRADERRLQQVVAHLLSNAVKFTGAGGSVVLSARADGLQWLRIQVADTGIGIAEADLGRVFEPFTQVEASLDRRFQGAGLGLYVSKALVEAQGGQLILTSKVGTGTLAEIRLPLKAQADASAPGREDNA